MLCKFSKLILSSLVFMVGMLPAQATNYAEHQGTLVEVERYLNSFTTFKSSFIQTDTIYNPELEEDRKQISGNFYLVRPDKLKVEYLTPSKFEVVISGKRTVYHDIELKEISHLKTDKSILGFLTAPKISFRNPLVKISGVQESADYISISLVSADPEVGGQLTLNFRRKPQLELINLVTVGFTGEEVSIDLREIVYNSKIPGKIFIIKDPRLGN